MSTTETESSAARPPDSNPENQQRTETKETETEPTQPPPSWVAIKKPLTCELKHVGCTLPNGVKLMLVEDPTATSAAAAMCIAAGSLQDPPELPGLAHLCEHMLFLGTEKYPEEGEYDKYISTHGGSDNAWTEDMITNYYFQINSEFLLEALDRFIHFFVCPLFTATSLEREVQAVHSEDEKNHNNDYWQLQEVWKSTVHPQHPASRYGNGNLATLWTEPIAKGVDVREKLLRFYEQYYVAEGAALCVVSPFPAEKIYDVVAPVLSKMKSGTVVEQSFGVESVIAPEYLGKWINIRSVKSMHQIRVSFVIPYSIRHQEKLPASYAEFLAGHECVGSVAHNLKSLGLITSLTSGTTHRGVDWDYDIFLVEIALTPAGVSQVDKVVDHLFQGIELIRRHGWDARLVEEDAETRELTFNLQPAGAAANHAARLSRGAIVAGIERAWSFQLIPVEKNPAESLRVLEYLVPSNATYFFRCDHIGDDLATNPTWAAMSPPEPCLVTQLQSTVHHKCRYAVVEVPPAWMDQWRSYSVRSVETSELPPLDPKLKLPQENPFIARDLTVFAPDTNREPKIVTNTYGRLIWRRDIGNHRVPLAMFKVELRSPLAHASAINRFFLRVLVAMIDDALTETLYFAELANVRPRVAPEDQGLGFSASGPNEKLPVVFQVMLKEVFYNPLPREKFDIFKDKVYRELKSALTEQPYLLGDEAMNTWTHVVRWTVAEVLDSASTPLSGYDNFVDYVAKFRKALCYDAMWYGNIPHNDPPTNEADPPPIIRQVINFLEGTCLEHKVRRISLSELPDNTSVLQLPDPTQLPPVEAKYLVTEVDAPPTHRDHEKDCVGWVISMTHPNEKDPNASVQVSYQLGVRNPFTRANASLLAAALRSTFFNALRTSETLGYIVSGDVKAVDETVALNFIVQSANFDCEYIHSRIFAFIQAAEGYLESSLTPESLQETVDSLIATLTDKPKSLAEEGQRLWLRRRSAFGYFSEDDTIAELKKASKAQLLDFFRERVLHSTRKIVVAVSPQNRLPFTPKIVPRSNDYETVLQALSDDYVVSKATVIRFVLPPRQTPLTGNEPLKLFSYGADGADATGRTEEPTEVFLRLVPTKPLEGTSILGRREAWRAALVPFPL